MFSLRQALRCHLRMKCFLVAVALLILLAPAYAAIEVHTRPTFQGWSGTNEPQFKIDFAGTDAGNLLVFPSVFSSDCGTNGDGF